MLRTITKYFGSRKKLYFGDDCRRIIQQTTKTVEKVVSLTLGPYGRNVAIENEMQAPRITKDGVTVVKHIQFENRLEDAICTLVKKSADGTNKYAGDGTTTCTLLIGQIMRIAYRRIAAGCSITQIRKGLQIGRDIGLQFLQSCSRKITTQQQLMNVMMIATNGNKQISLLIAEAVNKANQIKIEKSQKTYNHIQYYSGYTVVRGLESEEFVNHTSGNLVYNYPLVVISQLPLLHVKDVVKCLQMAKKARKQLIIFAEEISESVMSTLIYNNKKKIVEACGISVPAHGEAGKQALKQITQVTKSYPFTQFSDRKITEIEWEDFGKVRRIEIDKFETKIESISQEEENLNAIIMVGGVTETVMLEKYDLIVDALNSGKSAKKDGVVPGGGVAMWRLAELLEQYRGEGEAGVKILAEVLKVPRKKLTQFVDPDKQPLSGTEWEGFDVRSQKKVDMFEAGIVDSLNVAKSTLIDAISLCSVLIQVSVAIVPQSLNIDNVSLRGLNKKYSQL